MFDPDKVIPKVEGAISATEQAIARLEKIVAAMRRPALALPAARPHPRRSMPARLQALTRLYVAGNCRSC